MKELHLKFKMDTGWSMTRKIYASAYDEDEDTVILPDDETELNIPSNEYIEWLEDLAEKYLKQEKINADANKIMAKFESIKSAFNTLQNEITSVDEGMPIPDYLYNALGDACSQLESEIYD